MKRVYNGLIMGKRELVALLSFSSWCLVIVVLFFLTVPWVGLQYVIVICPTFCIVSKHSVTHVYARSSV